MAQDYHDSDSLNIPDWLAAQILLNALVYGVAFLCMGAGLFKTAVVVALTTACVYADYGRRFFIILGAIVLMLNIFNWIGAGERLAEFFFAHFK